MLARLDVPQPHRLVLGAAGQRQAVGAERHGHRPLAVCPWRVALCWPVLTSHSRTVLSLGAAGERQAVGAERHGQ